MIKQNLVDQVSTATGETAEKTEYILNTILKKMFLELNKPDGVISIRGFGTFKNTLSKKTQARDIKRNITIKIEPKRKILFKPSGKFKR